jgi:hypothetical protein
MNACDTPNTVDWSARRLAREALVIGGPAMFADGTPIYPDLELLQHLQAADSLGAMIVRVEAPYVLAFHVVNTDGKSHYVVQFPTSDYPGANVDDGDQYIEYKVVSFTGPWPCMHCYVSDGGTLQGVWPEAVNDSSDDPYGSSDMVCLVHGTVERVKEEEPDYADLEGYSYGIPGHAGWCDGFCDGDCLR